VLAEAATARDLVEAIHRRRRPVTISGDVSRGPEQLGTPLRTRRWTQV
jgi:hypothetical protein